MHKAISIIQFKLEGQDILAHPEYEMEDRRCSTSSTLNAVRSGSAGRSIRSRTRTSRRSIPRLPTRSAPEEAKVIEGLVSSFVNCEKLQRHIEFIYKKGSMYKYYNNCLMFHGCIPMEPDGSFTTLNVYGDVCSGKSLFDCCERLARQGRYGEEGSEERRRGCDFMWYLWCGAKSPLFGKDKMATFERYFLDDKQTHKEVSDAYFKLAYTRRDGRQDTRRVRDNG